ncbi:Uu.00g059340.m01.CDS01 [Anthostomella pinea]|uniref:Uu.00g059340.m01.CDS01 n=1 Tax=Anthostomella pinea TaxID=933095 RepID=A0AAI8VSV1_9PEZI|nr:Uu.00g059340.m01.CDS01 [Anthostomella pinea]
MACRSCRRQLTVLARQAKAVADTHNAAPAAALGHQQLLFRQSAPPTAISPVEQRRCFKGTSNRPASKIMQGLASVVNRVFVKSAEPYRVVRATEDIYKTCARAAAYTISVEDIKAGTIPKTKEGEDLGKGQGMWHEDFGLAPTFSTWSQVTMLHMYLIFARVRNMERDAAKSWQSQLVDHFFFDAEEKMDLVHGISSRGLRHRYLKDLFIQWRGVIAAYDEGVIKGDAVLATALWRNIYKARGDVDVRHLAALVSWMRRSLKTLDQMPDEALFVSGAGALKWPAKNESALVDKPTRQLEKEYAELAQEAPVVKKVAAAK